jgi:DNA-binding response OmpR family regulator
MEVNMARKILVVDDETELLKALTIRLKTSGYEVITAQDGQEGLEKAKSLNPDLIVLDILMPKMDGYEVCRLLKFDEKYKSIPIIMLTAKAQDIDKVMGKKVGADDYITKPFETQDLIDKIKKHLGE